MKKNELTPFGLMVVNALSEKGMTQVELAKELGVAKQYLHLVLHGMRTGRKYLSKISEICELDRDPDTKDTDNGGDTCEKSKESAEETGGDM